MVKVKNLATGSKIVLGEHVLRVDSITVRADMGKIILELYLQNVGIHNYLMFNPNDDVELYWL